MTLRTVTYDDRSHKIVPLEPTNEWVRTFEPIPEYFDAAKDTLRDAITAAPEYQEPTKDE